MFVHFLIDKQDNFTGIQDYSASEIIDMSREIRELINEKYKFEHPEDPRINGCSHILWDGDTISEDATARNAVFYGDKAIDRSACGTGTSSRIAQWAAKNGHATVEENITNFKRRR